jgi:alkaline phosphatase D
MKIKLLLIILFSISVAIYAQLNLGPIVGGVTESSAIFLVKTYKPQSVQIELFSEGNPYPSIYSETVVSDTSNFNYVKIPVQNLNPNTNYFYRAIIDSLKSKRWHSFKTFPIEKVYGFSFGFGSCQQSGYSKWNPEIFSVIAQDSLRFFIQIGDWTYPDSTEKKYGYRFNTSIDLIERSYQSKYTYNYPFVGEVLSQMPVVYAYDDHDFAANNPDGTDPAKQNSLWGYKTFFPHYPLKNPDNGIWQSFVFGDVEFFILDCRSQRNPNQNAFDVNGDFKPPKNHSLLSGFNISGENQLDWFLNALKKSTAKWKVIVSTVLFNPAYAKIFQNSALLEKYPWMKNDVIDKWAGFPNDVNLLTETIKQNNIKNVLVLSGDTHSSYIDDGTNSLIPEISASNLDVNNSLLHKKLEEGGINIWNQGTYNGNGHTYGKVSFVFGTKDYALLEVIDEKGEAVVSYRLLAK